MRIAALVCTAMILLGAVAAPTVTAETRPVEGAVEARRLVIEPGPPARVTAFSCDACPPRTFELDEDVKLFVGGERVSAEELERRQGHAGTVIYDLETGRAVRLRW